MDNFDEVCVKIVADIRAKAEQIPVIVRREATERFRTMEKTGEAKKKDGAATEKMVTIAKSELDGLIDIKAKAA